MSFFEPVAASAFSFLRGACQPGEMVARAHALGMGGIGIADRNTVAGVVRAYKVWKELGGPGSGFRLIVGARLCFIDGTPDIVAYPLDRKGWGRLTRLLSHGNLKKEVEKGDCHLTLDDLLAHVEGLALIAMDGDAALLERLRAATPHLWLSAAMPRGGSDARDLAQRMALGAACGVPLIATNDPLYAVPAQRPLHDVLTCIREGVPLSSAGRLLAAHAERHLKPPTEMARLFAACPQALEATGDLFSRIGFVLDELVYEYPHEPVPEGWEAQAWLEHRCGKARRSVFPMACRPSMKRRWRSSSASSPTKTTPITSSPSTMWCIMRAASHRRSCVRGEAVRPIRWSAIFWA